MHETLLTRGDFPKAKQYLIWSKFNCNLVHTECHPYAATYENQKKLIKALIRYEGYQEILAWLITVDSHVKGNQAQCAIRLVQEIVR